MEYSGGGTDRAAVAADEGPRRKYLAAMVHPEVAPEPYPPRVHGLWMAPLTNGTNHL
jgi:hypothetical protein